MKWLIDDTLAFDREACPARTGDDLSRWGWGEGKDGVDMKDVCRPLDIEVYEFDDSSLLRGWKQPEPPNYEGGHGMQQAKSD